MTTPIDLLKAKILADYPTERDNFVIVRELNANTLSVDVPILSADIVKYLYVNRVYSAIKMAAAAGTLSAVEALDGLAVFEYIHIDEVDVKTALTATLNDLVTDVTAFTTAHRDGILALGAGTSSWAAVNYGRRVEIRDIIAARKLIV